MTQPGVGPITSLAFVLTMGDVSRFPRGKQVASYLGLIPREYSSGGHQRLGSISKQGNRFMRMLLVEAAQACVRYDPQDFATSICTAATAKPKGVAKVAAARKLAVRLYWMLRTQKRIRRSFMSRAARGCPWSAQARPRVDWALSSRSNAGIRIEESWPMVRPYRWLVERFRQQLIHRESSRASVLHHSGRSQRC